MLRSIMIALALTPLAMQPTPVLGKTFVMPHVLEKSGSISNTTYTFDTTLFMTYSPTSPGGSASVDYYLFDQADGQPVNVGGSPVGTSYSVTLSEQNPSVSLAIDDATTAAFATSTAVKLGFGIVVVGGADPEGVNLQGYVVNSHTSPFDLSVFGFQPEEVRAASARTFVVPHVLESSGKTSIAGNDADAGGSIDTLLFPVYTGGLLGSPSGTADITLTLFNTDDSRMTAGGSTIAPYTVTLSDSNRSPLVALEDIIGSSNFGGTIREGYAMVSITGDAGNVALQGFIVNSHSGPFDVSITAVPEPTTAGLMLAAAGLGLAWYAGRRRRS